LVDVDGECDGIELGAVEVEGCNVGSDDGTPDTEGARLPCNVGPVVVVG